MQRNIIRGMISFFCVLIILFMVYFDNSYRSNKEQDMPVFQIGGQTIRTWEKDGVHYVFLPSFSNDQDVTLSKLSMEFTICDPQITVTKGSSITSLPFEKVLECTGNDKKFKLFITQSANVGTIFINTNSGNISNILADKEYKESGKIQVINEKGELNYSGGLDYMKGRGNYSWDNYDKKPFSISIKNASSLLGLPYGNKYVLVSNASDPSLIRNDITRGMEEALGMLYAGKGRFIDLYLNGDYQGNYYLCDSIEIGEQRINIANLEEQMNLVYQNNNYDAYKDYETDNKKGKLLDYQPEDITGGYLVEREFEDRYKMEYAQNTSCFVTDSGEHFIVQSPGYCSKEQIDYISSYFNEAEQSIFSDSGYHPVTGKKYSEYVDMDSYAKKYLVEEVSKNYDAGVSSSFFYKDSSKISDKIFAGPGWDYDMTFGNYLEWMEYFSKDPYGISRLTLHDHATSVYDFLYKKQQFYQLVTDYYARYVFPYLNYLVNDGISEYERQLERSADMDYIRWSSQYLNNSHYVNRNESFESLKNFVKLRKEFLDSVWIMDKNFHIVKFLKDGTIYEIRYIEDGTELGSLSETDSTLRWRDEKSGYYVNKNTVIKKETVLICD